MNQPNVGDLRPLGASGLRVSSVAMGCWPISGMTSLHVTRQDSLATLQAARAAGINFFDTAFCYGMDGESERLIAEALGSERAELVLATKGGIHWNPDGTRGYDARPATLTGECERSLRRLQTDYVDLLYLHAPDPATPLEESAAALKALQQAGKARAIGASNLNLAQLQAFHAVCPLAAFQPPYNMLQRQIEEDVLPFCREQGIAVAVYWPLLKGLLAGKLARDHQFPPADGRAKYPMFQGEQWVKNQDFVDELREIAAEAEMTVAQLVIAWTLAQPGITVALCGAKRPGQIAETAAAMAMPLTPRLQTQIAAALQRRGMPEVRSAV